MYSEGCYDVLRTGMGLAGPEQSGKPTALGFSTVSGQQLIAFHKPTTPLEPIAFYEDVLEPGLRIGVIIGLPTGGGLCEVMLTAFPAILLI